MFKKLISYLLIFTLLFSSSITVFSSSVSNQDINLIINGEKVAFSTDLYINSNEKLMFPIRDVFEKLDYKLNWEENSKSITLTKDSNIINLQINESTSVYNGKKINLREKPIIKDNKTYVSLEVLDNIEDIIIGWDSKYKTLNIRNTSKNQEDYFDTSEDSIITNNLKKHMDALEKNNSFYGSVLVAKEGKVLLDKGYGYSSLEQLIKNKSQTKYAIGSVTKQFVAMGIMQLSEKGLVDVKDKVAKYLPEFPDGESVTIHHLLTHSSGITNFTELPEFYMGKLELNNAEDVLKLIKDKPLEFNPGEAFQYSNSNYLILGILIEKISGISYENYLKENIFKPLNMKDTGFAYEEATQMHDATAYTGHLDIFPIDDEIVLANAYGAGNIYSTVEDLYRWDQGLIDGKLVKKETMDKIFFEHMDMYGVGHYGYGWMLGDIGIDRIIYHGGNTLGFTADNSMLKNLDISLIILSNKGYVDLSSVKSNLLSILLGGEVELPKAKEMFKVNPEIYDKYIGEYELLSGYSVTIIRENDKIFAQITGQERAEIFPSGETEFFYRIADATITFVKDDNGNTSKLVLKQLGQELEANKIK